MTLKSLYLRFAILCLAVFVAISECKVSPALQVTLPHGGGLTGKYMTSFKGRGVRAFMGIPFAEPPVGELRFQIPFPKLPWTGYIAANVDNKMCPQTMGLPPSAVYVGNEDCLYVNVFSPLEPKTKGPLPVMFFIHGGGFSMGNGGAPLYTPEYFLDHDVIFVSGNYRLGALGFLSLDGTVLPGNLGLKDQVLLLQWVQDNIATFGGDPNQVTIFGESAGAGSVAYHLISPLSYKKFHKAILQSGVQYSPWAYDFHGNNFKNAIALGKGLNCPLTKEKSAQETYLTCLKSKSAEEISMVSTNLVDIHSQLLNPFLPVAEESLEGMITKKPTEFKRSHGLDIPILIGVTSQEGVLKTAMSHATESNWEKMEANMDTFIDDLQHANDLSDARKADLRKMVKDFYFKNGRFERDNPTNTTDFFSDGFFIAPMDEFLSNRLELNQNSAETFVYLFSHRGAASLTDLFAIMLGLPNVDIDLGVCHADDLIYLFPVNKNMLSNIVPTKLDRMIQTTLTEMWVNFASTGNPTSSDSPVAWTPARGFPLDYLRIGNYREPEKEVIAMETGLLEERMQLWRRIKSVQ